ncbi:ribonuclease R [Oceaniglobus ichthyenteri]|uniref:ribonuclease R n=1 Tax=Oceaniglobus ichthyenteri TaxID=2136177 RepID=UPI000D3542C3|nr:ribonuclease R [Oceaniglobus ichthyenteri]
MKPIPTKTEILQWISDNPTLTAKRDIARAFGIKGAARIDLKRILKELEAEGQLQKRHKTYRNPESLPPVSVLSVLDPDQNGDLYAKPMEWDGDGVPPRILMVLRDSDPALGEGNRILARLTEVQGEDHRYEARLIRRIGTNPLRVLGVFRAHSEGGRILPIDKGSDREWTVAPGATHGAKDGELVEAEQTGSRARMGLPAARITDRLGDPSAPRAVSLIAIHQHGIPDAFSDAAIAQADAAQPAKMGDREDLRALPLVTIDPADARDRDDAVLALPGEGGGFILWVAIADVAHYVTPGSALDREAKTRGNSTYFPDRVVPMLPDILSGDLCSLHENVDRACIAVEMHIDAQGNKTDHRFTRGIMRSQASLPYEEVQDAIDGRVSDRIAPLMEHMRTLYGAFHALTKAREARQPLELDLPERQIILGEDGKVSSVAFKERLDAHRLIEEFMVLANVSAAEELVKRKTPLLFRIHEEPSPEKMEALREVAQASGFTLAKGQVLHTRLLNRLLAQADGTDHDELINMSTLRSMTQAYYFPENFGHFGLALRNYAHFTSPIRRYSDLIVHRALITAHGWGRDGLSPEDIETLEVTAKQISDTERRSMMAERDTTDRYLASYLSERVGSEMSGRISGVQKFGLFVRLDETGADGLIPVRSIGGEFYHFDADEQTLMGSDTGLKLGLGQRVTVRLDEAVPVTGGLTLELLELEGRALPRGGQAGRNRAPGRKIGKTRSKTAKIKRKVKRSRK